jgi:hypothetical protein
MPIFHDGGVANPASRAVPAPAGTAGLVSQLQPTSQEGVESIPILRPAAMRPTTRRKSLSSTVQICPLMPLGTFSPAAAHWLRDKSAFFSREVTGTTNRSPGQLP